MTTQQRMATKDKTISRNGAVLRLHGAIKKKTVKSVKLRHDEFPYDELKTVKSVKLRCGDEESIISLSDFKYYTHDKFPYDELIENCNHPSEDSSINDQNDEILFVEADVTQQFLSCKMQKYALGADFLIEDFEDIQDDEREDESSNQSKSLDDENCIEFVDVNEERTKEHLVLPMLYDMVGPVVEIIF